MAGGVLPTEGWVDLVTRATRLILPVVLTHVKLIRKSLVRELGGVHHISDKATKLELASIGRKQLV